MAELSHWKPCDRPGKTGLTGLYAWLEPFSFHGHGEALYEAICGADNDSLWHFIPAGPFTDISEFRRLLDQANTALGWQTMVIRGAATSEVLGMASFMRIREDHGSAEVGCVIFNRKLQCTRIATDAMYLMMRHIFHDLGYRRYEWKCDDANEASKRAAVRFGFKYEGVFRNDMVVKGQNRDTAWFAVTDDDWPTIDAAFTAWLDPQNFDAFAAQRSKLLVPAFS